MSRLQSWPQMCAPVAGDSILAVGQHSLALNLGEMFCVCQVCVQFYCKPHPRVSILHFLWLLVMKRRRQQQQHPFPTSAEELLGTHMMSSGKGRWRAFKRPWGFRRGTDLEAEDRLGRQGGEFILVPFCLRMRYHHWRSGGYRIRETGARTPIWYLGEILPDSAGQGKPMARLGFQYPFFGNRWKLSNKGRKEIFLLVGSQPLNTGSILSCLGKWPLSRSIHHEIHLQACNNSPKDINQIQNLVSGTEDARDAPCDSCAWLLSYMSFLGLPPKMPPFGVAPKS